MCTTLDLNSTAKAAAEEKVKCFCKSIGIDDITKKQEFTREELIKFNKICMSELSDEIKGIIKKDALNVISVLEAETPDICLTKAEAMQEVIEIQKNMRTSKNTQPIGYIFTNEHAVQSKHFETLIICPDYVIKPITWGNDDFDVKDQYANQTYIYPKQIPCFSYSTYLNSFLLNKKQYLSIPNMQGDGESCGPIGVLCLKELLKKQESTPSLLDSSSLLFRYYDNEDQLKGFFFPAPDIFRYSQSTFFNELLHDILFASAEETIAISRNGTPVLFRSLEAMLLESINMAEKNGNKEIARENKETLKKLPEFRTEWSKRYIEALRKRSEMDCNNGKNCYLAYRANKMKDIATKARKEASETKLMETDKSALTCSTGQRT